MDLPRKKVKMGRISQLVADLHRQPKRGGSLVVETGFPTSLIDLFVKNRDRLKKPSKCSHLAPPSPPPQTPPPPPPTPTLLLISSPSSSPPVRTTRQYPSNDNGDEEIKKVVVGEKVNVGGDRKIFPVAVLKIFMAVVLMAMTTKTLAVGITLLAFALISLEFAAARVLLFFRLCPNAQTCLDSSILRIIEKQQERLVVVEKEGSCGIRERCNDEIQVIESVSNVVSCVRSNEPELILNREKGSDCLATEKIRVNDGEGGDTIRVLMYKTERSRGSKLKSKFVKIIVPKKFRKKKPKKNEDKVECASEVSSIITDDKSDKIGEESPKRDENLQCPNDEILRNQEEFHVGALDSAENAQSETKENKVRLILMLVVLGGLLGGRVFAIGLTMVWCLVMKFTGSLNMKSRSVWCLKIF